MRLFLGFYILVFSASSFAEVKYTPEIEDIKAAKTKLQKLQKPEVAALNEVEKKYRSAKTIQMDVTKKLLIALLGKEKTSEGSIKIKAGGNLKWEIQKPEHQEVLLTPKGIWLVDYPADPDEKISVLKTKKPKDNQSPAIVTFLLGKGEITKNFKILSAKDSGDKIALSLKARSKKEVVSELALTLDKKDKVISQLSFSDALGNQTSLEFKKIVFNVEFDKTEFEFTPPPHSSVTVID